MSLSLELNDILELTEVLKLSNATIENLYNVPADLLHTAKEE